MAKRSCIHHWKCETPDGPVSQAICCKCGAVKTFLNCIPAETNAWCKWKPHKNLKKLHHPNYGDHIFKELLPQYKQNGLERVCVTRARPEFKQARDKKGNSPKIYMNAKYSGISFVWQTAYPPIYFTYLK